MMLKDKFKEAIEQYTERKVKGIEYYPDPNVSGTYAVQSTHKGSVLQWLVMGIHSRITVEEIIYKLEEVDFETWPPTSKAC